METWLWFLLGFLIGLLVPLIQKRLVNKPRRVGTITSWTSFDVIKNYARIEAYGSIDDLLDHFDSLSAALWPYTRKATTKRVFAKGRWIIEKYPNSSEYVENTIALLKEGSSPIDVERMLDQVVKNQQGQETQRL